MRILITRPEPACTETARQIGKMGHEAVCAPLLQPEFHDDQVIDLEGAQAIIVTSGYALRALARRPDVLSRAIRLPLYSVGPSTSRAAGNLGFTKIVEGAGNAADLAQTIKSDADPKAGRLIHLCGSDVAAEFRDVLLEEGFSVSAAVLYSMSETPEWSEPVREELREDRIDAVMLFSPRTADVYAALMRRNDMQDAAAKLLHFCLSDAVADRLGPLGDVAVRVADRPNADAMLAMIV